MLLPETNAQYPDGGTRMLAKTEEKKLDYGGATDRFKSCSRGYDESPMRLMCGCDRRCHVTSCVCIMKFSKSGDIKHTSLTSVKVIDRRRKREKEKRKSFPNVLFRSGYIWDFIIFHTWSPSGTCDTLTFVSTECCSSSLVMSGKCLLEKSKFWV